MKIQYFNGGLANQVFQYIFYRHAQLAAPQKDFWLLDDSFFFFKDQHNGYELEKVYTIPCNGFYPEILGFPGEVVYYFGYWINKNWLTTYKDQILSELCFPTISDEKNLQYATKIKNTLSVGVHIRRGDFVNLGWNIENSYYFDSAKKLSELYPELTFFVFSDDIEWCREHADELGLSFAKDIIFVDGNLHGKNYIDLQLMTMCQGLLMSNSSFSYLTALMNPNLSFYVNPVSFREV